MENLTPYANSAYQMEVAELKKKDLTIKQIIEETGRSRESVKAALRSMRKRARESGDVKPKESKRSYSAPINRKFARVDLLSIIALREQGMTFTEIADVMGCGSTAVREFINQESYKDFWDEYVHSPVASGEVSSPEIKRKKIKGKKFVFTAAQNNTHIHRDFLKSLERYCEHNDAQLIVSTFTYNKNGFQNLTKADEDLWYDPSITKYITNDPLELCDDLYFCGELNILPTAVNPLSGFNNYTGSASAIIPHTKVQLESIPTPKHDPCKLLYTTGAITQRNYIQKKAGQIAEWHHVYGATLVEIDNEGDWFVRQLIADSNSGCFTDMTTTYGPKGIIEDVEALAINWGDIHVAKLDQEVADVSWREYDSILHQLKPEYQFVHDVYDQRARNHHNVNDPHLGFELYTRGIDSVKDELMKTTEELVLMSTANDSKVIVVDSNHDRALERWLKESDYRKDPVNALIFLQLQSEKYNAISRGDTNFHLFEHAVNLCLNEMRTEQGLDANFNGQFLRLDESFRLQGIEFGAHGDMGANGSRGSPKGFAMQGVKHNLGHRHSCGIYQGVYIAGVSGELDMGYNKGGSSWSNSHVITYQNGKRTIVTLKKSKLTGKAKWRA